MRYFLDIRQWDGTPEADDSTRSISGPGEAPSLDDCTSYDPPAMSCCWKDDVSVFVWALVSPASVVHVLMTWTLPHPAPRSFSLLSFFILAAVKFFLLGDVRLDSTGKYSSIKRKYFWCCNSCSHAKGLKSHMTERMSDQYKQILK